MAKANPSTSSQHVVQQKSGHLPRAKGLKVALPGDCKGQFEELTMCQDPPCIGSITLLSVIKHYETFVYKTDYLECLPLDLSLQFHATGTSLKIV